MTEAAGPLQEADRKGAAVVARSAIILALAPLTATPRWRGLCYVCIASD